MTGMKCLALIALATASALPTSPAPAAPPPQKVTTVIVYGDDPCPRSSDEELVVCAREPESERYRIPEKLRKTKEKAAQRSWGDRVQTLETVSKAGLPNSCSPIGSGGQTGCVAQFLRQMREMQAAERRGAGRD